ncbi:helix-turn-helix domain-containing protein [Nonomuraea sp. NPDC050227]|uniref:helix-turn-helix domain-containing protein n=1 Tax=Nonomuraea sp. NPDC050227 TaxID=3364360 RepID=UPI0037A42171
MRAVTCGSLLRRDALWGRQIRPINPPANSVERFACELRALRAAAGDIPFWKMARRCGVSKSALADAVAGYRLPSERMLREFVTICDGDPDWWIARCRAAGDEVSEDGSTEILETGVGTALVRWLPREVAQRQRWMPAQLSTLAGQEVRRPIKFVFWSAAIVLAAAVFAAGWLARPLVGFPAVHATSNQLRPADGVDPYQAACGDDQQVIEQVGIVWPDQTPYGWLALHHSARCQANWGYVHGPNSTRWRVFIIVHRPEDQASTQSSQSVDLGPGSWSGMLLTDPGCVYIEAYIQTSTGRGRSAKTSCYKAADSVSHGTPTHS